MSKRERTKDRLQDCALALFESQGFEATTVAQIAQAAGVTSMTFFRHFATKSGALLDDPYDSLIQDSIAAQPRALPPLARAVAGLRAAWQQLPEPASDVQRRRVRVVATTPALIGEVHANNRRTQDLIVDQLVADGADPLAAEVASAATLAAVTAGLLAWATADSGGMGSAVVRALAVLEGES